MPIIPEAAYVILASSEIGAVHFMVFAEFSAQSLKNRFADVQSALVVTANEGQKKKVMALKTSSKPPSVRGTAMTPSQTLTGSLATPTSSAVPSRTDVPPSCSSRCPRETPGRYWDMIQECARACAHGLPPTAAVDGLRSKRWVL